HMPHYRGGVERIDARRPYERSVIKKSVIAEVKKEPDSSKKNSCAVQAPTGEYTAGEGQSL
ncbi:hypothetical protein, partial [Enterobacter sp.]|uniref:hypothetical protein n=1 Tax=Enterobacter sp. TaxID=42895 RepID=UPI003A92CBC0